MFAVHRARTLDVGERARAMRRLLDERFNELGESLQRLGLGVGVEFARRCAARAFFFVVERPRATRDGENELERKFVGP